MAADAGTSNYVYVLSDAHSWIPARVVEYKDNVGAVVVSIPQFKDEDQITSDGGKHSRGATTKTIELKRYPNKTLPLQNVDENGMLLQVDDMVDLPFLHEPAILYNLKARHREGKPYTRTGDIVIAVNPYQWIMDLYSEPNKTHYANQLIWSVDSAGDARAGVEPHVYETSSMAYRGLAVDGQDQSILVSGESGAGKTETVKILMSHLASVQAAALNLDHQSNSSSSSSSNSSSGKNENANANGGEQISPIVQRVLDSNPLLEAFGNAKTVRNDNSSRFGKYLQLQFDHEDPDHAAYRGKAIPSCVLAGSKCEVFLLEKSRVVGHEEEERTYHIFYQLLAADEDKKAEIWSGLQGADNESFLYVGYTDTDTIEGKKDAERFDLTKKALELIGVKDEMFITLMRAMCIVLQLGNQIIEADPNDEERSVITSTDELHELSDLMGVDEKSITNALTERTVRARNEEFTVPLKADQATDSRDALAKEIYAKAFLWLVRSINDATCAEWNYDGETKSDFGLISLLDIFGFESFTINRFEQLCINHANEKLQQKFTQDIFRSVQAEYEFEGIELGEIQYEDNAYVLDLVEGRMGMIAVLNEECLRPKGSDAAFVSKVQAVSRDSEAFFTEKSFQKHEFGIKHYAGKVIYDATNFVQKNMDALPSDLLQCAKMSSNAIVSKELENEEMMNEHGKKAAPKKKPPTAAKKGSTMSRMSSTRLVHQTVWTKFRTQLNSLMGKLGQTRTRYIRCIKPNTIKVPRSMMHISTVEQLRCAGVVAAVTISRSAFPNRLEHEVVLDRFKPLWTWGEHPTTEIDDPMEARKNEVENLLTMALKSLEACKDEATVRAFVIGRTRAYFRAGALEHLEAERLKGLSKWATEIGRAARGFVARSQFKRKRRAAIKAVAQIRQFLQRRRFIRILISTIVIQCWTRCIHAKLELVRLRRGHGATQIQKMWRGCVALAFFKKNLIAATTIQAVARGAIQRPRFRQKLQERREEAKLENQLKVLQRKLEEAEQRRIEAEKRAEEKSKEILVHREKEVSDKEEAQRQQIEQQQQVQLQHPLQEQQQQQQVQPQQEERKTDNAHPLEIHSNAGSSGATPDVPSHVMSAQQQALMDESGKMLEYLRKEVFKLRSQNAQLRTDFDLLKENNQRLMDANASAGASFAALNQHAKQLNKGNAKLSAEVSHYKQLVQKIHVTHVEVKEELKMKQATYIAEVHSRLKYQKTMAKMVDAIQERCRDSRLVEYILQMSDECEESDMDDAGSKSFQMTNLSPNKMDQQSNHSGSIVSRFTSFFS